MSHSFGTTLRTIFLSLLAGTAAGVLSASVTGTYLSDYALQLSEWTGPIGAGETRPRSVPQTYAEAVERVREKASPALARFFDPSTLPSFDGMTAYDAVSPTLQGIVLTSDGWILTVRETAEGSIEPDRLATFSVAVGREVYTVEQVVPHATGAFIKVAAENVPVIAFGSGWEVEPGEQLFALSEQDGLWPVAVAAVTFGNGEALPDTEPARTLTLATFGAPFAPGTPVVNAGGELVGVMNNAGTAEPVDELLPLFNTLLRTGKPTVSTLGVRTIDLAHATGFSEMLTRGHTTGALVTDAGTSDLKEGDIILAVDGERVDAHRTLAEYIRLRDPGDTLTLTVDRDGETLFLSVPLAVSP